MSTEMILNHFGRHLCFRLVKNLFQLIKVSKIIDGFNRHLYDYGL
jgi:hypothetical protein